MSRKIVVVSDTSPITNLILINQLLLLEKVFNEIIIPDKVYLEILQLKKFLERLNEFKQAKWIIRKSISDALAFRKLTATLDEGEAEAIVLAREVHADYLLVDEKKGRKQAAQMGLNTIGLLGVLLKAKQQKHIPAVKPYV